MKRSKNRISSPKLQMPSFIVTGRFGSIAHIGDSPLSERELCSLIGLDPDNNVWADRIDGSAGWGFIISDESGEYVRFLD